MAFLDEPELRPVLKDFAHFLRPNPMLDQQLFNDRFHPKEFS